LVDRREIRWATPAAYDLAPDALIPLRSLLAVERWFDQGPPADKYPEAFHLLAGVAERIELERLAPAEKDQVQRLQARLEERAQAATPEAVPTPKAVPTPQAVHHFPRPPAGSRAGSRQRPRIRSPPPFQGSRCS